MDFETLAQKRNSALQLMIAFTCVKLNVRLTNMAFMRIMESCYCPAKTLKLTQPSPMPWGITKN